MRAEAALYRNSARFFALFLLGLVVAFWPSYFARLFEQPSLFFHLHGVALTLWALMLVAQAQLIRTGRRSLHRQIGKASYVLAPAVVAITVSFVHYRVAGSLPSFERLPPFVPYFLALTLNSLIVFAVFYALAIYHRRDAGRHARWMISTVFPLFTPITDRLESDPTGVRLRARGPDPARPRPMGLACEPARRRLRSGARGACALSRV